MLTAIISGGQTGVDRAALDVARALGFKTGGYCPKGRRSEDGVIPAQYHMTEVPARSFAVRTRLNVHAADATLILIIGTLTPGSKQTFEEAVKANKPALIVDIQTMQPSIVTAWLKQIQPNTLNVAGSRESKAPGIGAASTTFLTAALKSALQ